MQASIFHRFAYSFHVFIFLQAARIFWQTTRSSCKQLDFLANSNFPPIYHFFQRCVSGFCALCQRISEDSLRICFGAVVAFFCVFESRQGERAKVGLRGRRVPQESDHGPSHTLRNRRGRPKPQKGTRTRRPLPFRRGRALKTEGSSPHKALHERNAGHTATDLKGATQEGATQGRAEALRRPRPKRERQYLEPVCKRS